MHTLATRAFTLVEILIVVVILGILSAIIVPQFTSATEEASATTTLSQLKRTRQAIELYVLREGNQFPHIPGGSAFGNWGSLISADYLRTEPVNTWVGSTASKVVIHDTQADSGYQTTHGWIYDPATGSLWAGGFDADDLPYARP